MDNVFLTQYFDWDQPGSRKTQLVNAVLAACGSPARLLSPGRTGSMTNLEQRLNIFHLVMQVLAYGVEGELVELGTLGGSTAVLIENVIGQFGRGQRLHVYDTFHEVSVDQIRKTFTELNLRPPITHAGWLEDTVPAELPERACFAHIDVGPAKSPEHLGQTMRHCVSSVYSRLARGAVCLIADYCESAAFDRDGFRRPVSMLPSVHWNQYPQVKQACDEFLADKPEKVFYLYAGEFSHGFFRKA